MIQPLRLLLGILLGFGIALAARKLRTLNRSGMWAAGVLGSVVMGIGGLRAAVLLMAFFISSSLLSKLFKRRKAVLEANYAKGGERDAWQVLANGGVAGLFMLLWPLMPESSLPWLGFAGALAAANADTWATELGALSPTPPRLITSLKAVARGTSGGVTLTGTLAAFSGAGLIGLLAWLFWPPAVPLQTSAVAVILAVALAGLTGSLADSLLGANLQSIYYCPICAKETERHPLHSCGNPSVPLRGLPWLDNDWVNTACTLCGGVMPLVLLLLR